MFLNIYEIAEKMAVMLKIFSNIHVLYMFALKMFYKCLIATGFHTHHFNMIFKCLQSKVFKKNYHTHKRLLNPFFRILIKDLPLNILEDFVKIAPHAIS